MTNSKSHPMHYTEAHYRGEVDKTRWGTTWGAVGAGAGTLGAAHLIGKIEIPTGGYRDYLSSIDAKEGLRGLSEQPKKPVNDMLKHIDEAVKAAGKEADEAAKSLAKNQGRALRAGKWGAAVAGGLTVGAVAANVGGKVGKVYGTFQGPNEAQADSWSAKEQERRSVTVNLENGR